MTFNARRPRTRILTAVVALLFAVGAIPLIVFGLRLADFNREQLESQQKEYQLVVAEAISRQAGEYVQGRRAEVVGFARGLEAALALAPATLAMDMVQDEGFLNRYVSEDSHLLKLMIATPSPADEAPGYELIMAEREAGVAAYAAAEEKLVSRFLEQAFEGRLIVQTAAGDRPLLIIVCPVMQGDRVGAVVAGIVSFEALREQLMARAEQLYLIYLTDEHGEHLLGQSRAARPGLLDSELVRVFKEAGGTRTMSFELAESDKSMLGAYATVPTTGWGVFVEVDADTAYFAVQQMREKTLVWSIGSILAALIFGTLFARMLVRPIRELADGALRLSRGDFSRPIELRSTNELGTLADSFNHMADEISQQIVLLEGAARQNKELFLSTVRMLAEAIDEKDPYTRGHSERVTRYGLAVAAVMGLDAAEVEKVQIGALLHDVGKIGIDDRILRKPSMLTDAEFAIMKQHPEKGAHIMGAVRELAHIIPGMRFHHEKVDGTGYPLGLKGDEIPLAAQIISVADTFDAMTTDRPYQKAMAPEFVVGKLKGWVGTRFRGDVVEAFERAFQQGRVVVDRAGGGGAIDAAAPMSRTSVSIAP